MDNNHSTKDLRRVLGRGDLMGIAVGQIIGAGVMVMSISALGMTGRSVNIAFVMASAMVVVAAIPVLFFGSCVRLRGGTYTQAALFVGHRFAGFYIITYLFTNISIAMYAMGIVSYLLSLFPALAPWARWWSAGLLTLFFVLNFFGTKWMARVQNILFYVLIAALLLFVLFGLPRVEWAGYFGNTLFGRPLFENGLMGLFRAAAFLTFATGGATVVVNMSAEAVSPKRDIPFVVIVSTVGVGVVYALIATCIGGILPPDEVLLAGNLAPIARAIMPLPLYYFFIIGGAMFALATTMNATIGWVTKPILQACEDGWFPHGLGVLHPKYNTPYLLLLFFWIINLAPIFFGLDISQIGQWVLLLQNIVNVVLILGVCRLPRLFPQQWARSPFRVPLWLFYTLQVFAALVAAVQALLMTVGMGRGVLLANLIILVVACLYSFALYGSGKVKMTVSYDLD